MTKQAKVVTIFNPSRTDGIFGCLSPHIVSITTIIFKATSYKGVAIQGTELTIRPGP